VTLSYITIKLHLKHELAFVPILTRTRNSSQTASPHILVLALWNKMSKVQTYVALFDVFSDRASQYRLVSSYQLNAHFLYSITIYMLHYNLQHVSSSTMLIFRRTNCIITASGIVTLERGERSFTSFQSDDTRCCDNTICPPVDEHSTARNMSRIIM